MGMAYANLDELRFFLDDRDDVAERVHHTGASTTEVMVAIGLHETHRDANVVPQTVTQERIATVCSILREEDDAPVELSLEDVEWIA